MNLIRSISSRSELEGQLSENFAGSADLPQILNHSFIFSLPSSIEIDCSQPLQSGIIGGTQTHDAASH